jgi:hypothetical protein
VFIHVAYGQCENNVSTDYNQTPINNALPTNSPQPTYGQKFLNEFDWVPRSVNQTVAKYQTINMNSNILDAGEIQNIYSNQQNPFYSYLYNDIEPNPQNGWELISVNLGYFPNGDVQLPSSDHTDFPYLILYNKYRSILRVFGVLGAGYSDFGTSIDGVVVKLFIEDLETNTHMNGLLRRAEGTDKTLDQETEFFKMASVTKHQNQKGKWFSADFQIAYDPCVCFYDSRLRLQFDFIETAFNFDAQINSISIEEDLVENNSGLADVDFLNNFNYTETGSREYDASNGYLIYDAIDNLLENYEQELTAYEDSLDAIGKHNEQVTKRKWIVKAGKFVLRAGTLLLTGGGSAALELQQILPIIAPELMKTANELNVDIIPKLQEILGIGSEMFISEWVGEEVNPEDYPDQPMHPTATFTQSTMRGTIQRTIDDYSGPLIRTPGSYSSTSPPITTPHEYPVYNEALGVFALLEKPKINISRSFKNFKCEVYKSTPFSEYDYWPEEPYEGVETDDLYSASIEEEIQIELRDNLKYTFNPVLEIEDYSISTSFVVEGGLKLSNNSFNYLYNNSDETTDIFSLPNENINIESISFNAKENEVYKDHGGIINSNLDFNSIYIPLDALNSTAFSFGLEKNFKESPTWITNKDLINKLIESPFNSCDFLSEMMQGNGVTTYEVGDVYLKLLININFKGDKSNGAPHEYTYMFTYKIDPLDIDDSYTSSLYPNLPGSIGDITQYPENLVINGEDFNGAQIAGCQLNGATYTCKAWNDITLSGEFTVSNGYNVNIEAGNEVLVEPEANTPPEMVWQIVPVLDYSNPMPPVEASYVSGFCSDVNQYKARSSNMPVISTDSIFVNEEDVRDVFAFNIFPNPTSGSSTVSITLNEAAKGELFITDMNGRTLTTGFSDQTLRAGQTDHQLPTASLANGIYLVHLFVDGERHVKRLVKQ